MRVAALESKWKRIPRKTIIIRTRRKMISSVIGPGTFGQMGFSSALMLAKMIQIVMLKSMHRIMDVALYGAWG